MNKAQQLIDVCEGAVKTKTIKRSGDLTDTTEVGSYIILGGSGEKGRWKVLSIKYNVENNETTMKVEAAKFESKKN